MSIRPIDVKMAIPKTQEISKIEQNNQDKLKFSLEMQTNEQNNKIDKQLKTVNYSEKLSKSKVEKDKKENKKRDKNSHEENESPSDKETEETIKDAIVGRRIDIKV